MSSHSPLFAVSLIDARTGRAHRIGGTPLTLFTRAPEAAAQEMLRNRDPRHWRIETRACPGTAPF